MTIRDWERPLPPLTRTEVLPDYFDRKPIAHVQFPSGPPRFVVTRPDDFLSMPESDVFARAFLMSYWIVQHEARGQIGQYVAGAELERVLDEIERHLVRGEEEAPPA